MSRKATVELLGDPASLIRSFKRSAAAAAQFQGDLRELSVTAKQSAEAQVQAAVKRDARLRQEISAYRQIASSAKRGSQEQVIAARKAALAEGQLSRSLGVTGREQRQLASSASRAERELGRATRGTLAGSGALRSMGRSLAFASAGFLSFAAVAHELRSSISAASDLTEEVNKSNIVFRGSQRQVLAWSKTLIPAFGLTRTEALRTAATFGNMLVPMGFVRRQAAGMSERLVVLAGDMASFNNASPVDTLKALRSGLANQPRPLRQFGVFLDQARIAAEALSSGIVKANVNMGKVADAQRGVDIAQARLSQARQKFGKNSIEAAQAENTLHGATRGLTSALGGQIPKLTTAQRTLAIYRLILKDTADAHGDAARTGHNFAGEMRALHAEIGNVQEEIGRLLLPTTLQYVRALTDWLAKSKNQQQVLHTVKQAVHAISGAVAAAVPIIRTLSRVANRVADDLGGWKRAVELLIALKVASKVAGWLGPMERLGADAKLSTARLVGLRGALAALPAAVSVAVVLEVQSKSGAIDSFLNKIKSLNKRLFPHDPTSFLLDKKGPLGFLFGIGATDTAGKAGLAAGRAWARQFERGMRTFNAAVVLGRAAREAPRGEDVGLRHPGARGAPAVDTTAARRRLRERLNDTALTLPFKLQLQQARAEAVNNNGAILAAARAIRAWVLNILKTLHGQRLISAYSLLGQANDTIASAAKEAADKAKAQAQAAKQKLADARRKMQEAIDNVRQQIGELFQGPVLAPTDAEQKAKLGVPGPSPKDLVRDLRAQTAQFARFNRDLTILQRRGAPKELIRELRAQGISALPQIEALVGASRKVLNEFFKAFRSRERLVQRVARVEMRAQNVHINAATLNVGGRTHGRKEEIHLYIDGREVDVAATRHHQRRRSTTAPQVRGRHPGRTEID